jgi:hypothetical protein
MATVTASTTAPRPRPTPTGRRRLLLVLAVLALLLVESLPPERRASAGGPSAAEVVPAVVAAYGEVGTLAVVVAHQQVPVRGLSIRATEARTARIARSAAGNDAADRPFPTASMVKLFVAEDILHRVRTGQASLGPNDLRLLENMIRRSDDAAASTLWVRFGAGRMVTDVATRYGLAGTAPPVVPGEWGEATTTARDLARFLVLLPTVAHPEDAATLMSWMSAATPQAADGFDQRFGLFGTAPALTPVKQGWMCCVGGNRHLHSVGVVGTRVVVFLSEVPRRVGYDAARAALTAAAAAVPPPETP